MTKMKKFILGIAAIGCFALAGGVATQENAPVVSAEAAVEYTVVETPMTVHITNDYIPNGNFSIYLTLPQTDAPTGSTSISVSGLATTLNEFGFYDNVMIGDKTLKELGFEGAWADTLTYNDGEPKNIVRIPCHTENKAEWQALNDSGEIQFTNGVLQNDITLKEGFTFPGYTYFTGAENPVVYRTGCDYKTVRVKDIAYDRNVYGETDIEDLKVTAAWDGASTYIGVSFEGDDYLGDGSKLIENENHMHFYANDYKETVLVNGDNSVVFYYGVYNINDAGKGYYSFRISIPETEVQTITIPKGTRFPTRAMQEIKSINNGNTVFMMYETQRDMTFVNAGDGFVLIDEYSNVVKQEILDARAAKVDAEYFSEDVAEMDEAVANAMNGLLTAETVADITAIKEACLAVINAKMPKTEVVATAKADLDAYKAEADYFRAEEAATRLQLIETSKAAIDNASNPTEVQNAVDTAKAGIDALKTAMDYINEELAPAKSMASEKVETYLADVVYFLEERELIATAKAVALEAITAAKTEEEILSARDAFTQTMDGFATKESYVQAAKDELNAYTVGVVDVELIVSGAISSMELVDSKAELDSLLVAAKTAVDEKRSVSVQAAKDAINAKKASVLFNEYSESNQAVINALYKAAQDAIKNAKTQADLDSAVANFISGIDALEKLAPEKESSGKKGGCGSIVGLTTVGVLACAGVALLGKKKED